MPRFSIIEYFGCDDEGHQCGYCKGTNSSLTYGMWGHTVYCDDYQDLIDRGWRRSGKYLYKSIMDKTCCPMYTIRNVPSEFKPTKSQKKVIKRFWNYIIHDKGKKEFGKDADIDEKDDISEAKDPMMGLADQAESRIKNKMEGSEQFDDIADQLPKDKTSLVQNTSGPRQSVSPTKSEGESSQKSQGSQDKCDVKPGLGADPNKPKAKKAKEIRREKALLKGKQTSSPKPKANAEKSLEDLINMPIPKDAKHTFEIRTVLAQVSNPRFAATYSETVEVYKKYQMAIHGDDEDQCTPRQFKRFLCESSLKEQARPGNGLIDHGYGAFHQQYVIDGRIVAVGVVDILRDCFSSVYLYYDPEFSFLSMGTVSSLFEIAYTKQLNACWPELKYYYMGFYIHSCPKMRYKAKYSGSYLLCPDTYNWVPVDKCQPILDQTKYARLADPDLPNLRKINFDLGTVLILHERQAMSFSMYKEWRQGAPGLRRDIDNDDDDDEPMDVEKDDASVKEYAELVGERLTQKMLLFRA